MLGALAAVSCGNGNEASLLGQRLYDGRTIASAVATSTASANMVLVYEAEMCFSCSTMFSRWEALANDGSVSLFLMLDKAPKQDTKMALQRQRIPVSGVVRDWPSSDIPSEHLIVNGRVVMSAIGLSSIRRVAMWDSVDDILSRMQRSPAK
ncbi:MAG: hypothetical protein IT361_09890 [Gemmatimonadaceae bacterium]|nr:hypothetical protein [Gemmatimonadaceae bacterium]